MSPTRVDTNQHESKTGPRWDSFQNLRAVKHEALLFNKSI